MASIIALDSVRDRQRVASQAGAPDAACSKEHRLKLRQLKEFMALAADIAEELGADLTQANYPKARDMLGLAERLLEGIDNV